MAGPVFRVSRSHEYPQSTYSNALHSRYHFQIYLIFMKIFLHKNFIHHSGKIVRVDSLFVTQAPRGGASPIHLGRKSITVKSAGAS